MKKRATFVPFALSTTMLAAATLGAVFAACSSEPEGTAPSGSSTSGTGSGMGAGNAGVGGLGGVGTGSDIPITSLAIDPPSATLTVDQTTPKTQLFKAKATLPTGG